MMVVDSDDITMVVARDDDNDGGGEGRYNDGGCEG